MKQEEDNPGYIFLSLFILIAAVLLRCLFYMGPSGADDMIYFSVIEKLLLHDDAGKSITSSLHWGMRLGMIFPVWAIMKLFGVSELTSMVFPMLLSAGTLFFIYFAGRSLFNPAVALIASSVYAILPLDVYYSGVMYPDGPVVLFSALFLYLLYRVTLNENIDIKGSLLAGLMLGCGYLIRETSLLLFIAFPILFFKTPKKKNYITSVIFVIAGLLSVMLIEMFIVWHLTGDPFARFNMLAGKTNVFTPNQYQFHPRFHSYFVDGIILCFATHWIAPLMIPLIIGTSILFFSGRESGERYSAYRTHFVWLFILTAVILLFYIYAPVIGFTKPLERDERYYLVIMPFAAILLGYILYEFFRRGGWRRPAGYSLVFFYVFASVISLGSIMNKNSLGLDLMDGFMKQHDAENYIIPAQLKPVLHLKNGPQFMQGKIITYTYDETEISDFLKQTRKDGAVQYIFDIPKLHEIQTDFTGHIKWPLEKMETVEVMTTSARLSCRILRANDVLYEITPDLIKSRICFTADMYVYRLK
ncbi:MAG: glycosyltransferase family 39 protein [Nitrospirae bacterium]|nr:glycosyltransferase family 39 protein [Nitrospirota bacterium]